MSSLKVGDRVKYWSQTLEQFLDAVVTQVNAQTAAVELSIKLGTWISKDEQIAKIQKLPSLSGSLVVWVDANPDSFNKAHVLKNAGLSLRGFINTADALHFFRQLQPGSQENVAALITSPMHKSTRDFDAMPLDGLGLIDEVRHLFKGKNLGSMPIFAVVSKSVTSSECMRHSVDVVVSRLNGLADQNLWKVVQDRVLQALTSRVPIGDIPAVELEKPYDLVVIGGGPAGVAAGTQAALLGCRAIVVDRPKLPPDVETGLDVSFGGPTGLWSKALRDTAKSLDVQTMRSMRLDDSVIWKQVQLSCLELARQNASHEVESLKKLRVGYLQGTACILSNSQVSVRKDSGRTVELTTQKVLVATGSSPQRMEGIPFDRKRIFDTDTINMLDFLPRSVAITGAGIIAIEYAKIFRQFGAQVTMLVRSTMMDALKRIGLDVDIARNLMNSLKAAGVAVLEGATAQSFEVSAGSRPVVVQLASKSDEGAPKEVECDIYLAATGRIANVKNIGLEDLGCDLEPKGGYLTVDKHFQTTVPGIYACGDVIGPPSLASTGIRQAQIAVERMFNEGRAHEDTELDNIPVGIWTTPEIGTFGLTKEAALKDGLDAEEGESPFRSCLRGRVFAPEGLLKLVFNKENGVIVGVHIIGSDACELIHYGMDLVRRGISIFDVISSVYVAVTFHELFREAALDGNRRLEYGLEARALLMDLATSFQASGSLLADDRLRALFDAIDTNHTGSLDVENFCIMCDRMGCTVNRRTIANLVRVADKTDSGTIEWEEFESMFQVVREMHESQPQLSSMRYGRVPVKSSRMPDEPG